MKGGRYILVGVLVSTALWGWYHLDRPKEASRPPAEQKAEHLAPEEKVPQQTTSVNPPNSSSAAAAQGAPPVQEIMSTANLSGPAHTDSPDTMEDRQKYYDELRRMSVETLWQHWQGLLNHGSYVDRVLATSALAQKLQQEGNGTVYLEAADLLRNPALSAEQRALGVNLLGQSATTKAIEVLANVLREGVDETLRTAIGEGIKTAANQRWNGRFHPELSPPLQAAWQTAPASPNLLQALAEGLAKVGAPSGVESLLTAIAAGNKTVEAIYGGNNARAITALQVMADIRNPEALPVLVKWFTSRPLDEAAFEASGDGLAGIGTPEATRILIEWAKQAPEGVAPLVRRWMGMIQNDSSLELLRNAASTTTLFASSQVKQTVVEALQ